MEQQNNIYEIDGETFILTKEIIEKGKEYLKKCHNSEYKISGNIYMGLIQDQLYIKKSQSNHNIKIIKYPRTMKFINNSIINYAFIISYQNFFEMCKKFKLKNPHYKIENNSISLNMENINDFLDSSKYNEIYESIKIPLIKKEDFIQVLSSKHNIQIFPKLLKEPEKNTKFKLFTFTFTYYLINPEIYFPFLKEKKIDSIYYYHPLRQDKNDKTTLLNNKICSMCINEKKEDFILQMSGCKGIGKTLKILYNTKEVGFPIYINYKLLLDLNFQNIVNIFFLQMIFCFFPYQFDEYEKLKQKIIENIKEENFNNIFTLLFLFIENYNIENLPLFIIIDDYIEEDESNLYLNELIELIQKRNNFRLIINYSLDDDTSKKRVLENILNKNENFLYFNNLGINYELLNFENEKINKVLKEFNYLPSYYFNNYKLFEEDNSIEDIIKQIKNKILNEFQKIKNIGYYLSILPCIDLYDNQESLISLLSKIPIKYFHILFEKEIGKEKIKIEYQNKIIKEIVESLINEKLCNLIITDYRKIINNNIITGIAYEIYITNKIINNKKFGKYDNFSYYKMKEIANFEIPDNFQINDNNILIYQSNYNGRSYDLIFLIKKNNNKYRLLLIQISISKSLEKIKSVIFNFNKDSKVIISKLNKTGIEIETKELFFIFPEKSDSIETCITYNIPFVFFSPYNNAIYSKDMILINDFPENLFQISQLKFIFSVFSPLNKNCFKLCKFNYNNNDSLLIEKKYNNFYYNDKIFKLYPIIIFNNFKIGSQKIKLFNSICFFFNNKYLVLPKNNKYYKK